ncbi:hypothetical protein ACWG0P_05935 [Amedibacillus sp. YH-ame6]
MHKIKTLISMYIKKKCLLWLEKQSSNELYDQYTVNEKSVMWCIMPLEEEKLKKVPFGHRIRPFVIIKSNDLGCIGYACSSKDKRNLAKTMIYEIKKEQYDIGKNSYVDLSREWYIPYENVQSFYYELSQEEYQKIIRLEYNCSRNIFHYKYSVGAILEKGGRNFILYKQKDRINHVHPLQAEKREDHICQPFSLNGTIFYLDFSESYEFQNEDEYKKVMYLSNEQRKSIMDYEKVIEKRKKFNIAEERLIEQIYFEYPVGTVFYDFIRDENIIYLYHKNHRSYGVNLDNDDTVVRRIDFSYLKSEENTVEMESLLDILNSLHVDPLTRSIINYLHNELEKNIVKGDESYNIQRLYS